MKIGLIGTGSMGSRAGTRLLQASFTLLAYDQRREALETLQNAGACIARDIGEVVEGSDVIVTSLPNEGVVRAVMLESETGLFWRCSGKLIIDISTSTPQLARELALIGAEHSILSVDAPLLRGGEFIVVGADQQAFQQAFPVLAAIAPEVTHIGPPGAGQTFKLIRQYASFCYFFAEAEAVLTAQQNGLDVPATIDLLARVVGPTPERTRIWNAALRGDFGEPGKTAATLDIVAKDIRLAVDLAAESKGPTGFGSVLSDLLNRALARGWGPLGYWSAMTLLEHDEAVTGTKTGVNGRIPGPGSVGIAP